METADREERNEACGRNEINVQQLSFAIIQSGAWRCSRLRTQSQNAKGVLCWEVGNNEEEMEEQGESTSLCSWAQEASEQNGRRVCVDALRRSSGSHPHGFAKKMLPFFRISVLLFSHAISIRFDSILFSNSAAARALL